MFLCRAGFLLLCVAPTLFISAAAVRYRSSSYLEARREEWCAVLSDKLGLEVHIGRLSYPLWNEAMLDEVVFLDPETGQEVIRTRYVEVRQLDGVWQVVAGQPEVDGDCLPLLMELLNHRLLRGQALKLAPLRFESRELTVRKGDVAQTFQQVAVEIVTTDAGKRLAATFQVAGAASTSPAELTIERRRGEATPRTSFEFSTSGNSMPCGAIAPLWPAIEQLGPEATFNGRLSMESVRSERAAVLEGSLENVLLERLISQQFPHHTLTGNADVVFQKLQLRGGKIAEMNGTFQTHGPGTVSRSLLKSMAQTLDLAPDNKAPVLPPAVRYRTFAFGFQLDGEGLALTGFGDPSQPGVIMAGSKAGALLTESSRPVVPAHFLIPALSSQSEVMVPATSEARMLFDLLPLPLLTPSVDSDRPRATMRLHRDD